MFCLAQVVRSAQGFKFQFIANVFFLMGWFTAKYGFPAMITVDLLLHRAATAGAEHWWPTSEGGCVVCPSPFPCHRIPDFRLRITTVYHLTPGQLDSYLLPAWLRWVLEFASSGMFSSDPFMVGWGSLCSGGRERMISWRMQNLSCTWRSRLFPKKENTCR